MIVCHWLFQCFGAECPWPSKLHTASKALAKTEALNGIASASLLSVVDHLTSTQGAKHWQSRWHTIDFDFATLLVSECVCHWLCQCYAESNLTPVV